MVHWLSSSIFPCLFGCSSRHGDTGPNFTSFCPRPPKPLLFLKAYHNAYSKMNREHKNKDKDEYKDNDKDKDAKKITESLTECYIFGILTTQAFQVWWWIPPPALLGHSCKTGNVRYGGTLKTQNWNYKTFDNFVLKFFHAYVIQLEINCGPPLSTFFFTNYGRIQYIGCPTITLEVLLSFFLSFLIQSCQNWMFEHIQHSPNSCWTIICTGSRIQPACTWCPSISLEITFFL